MEQVSGPVIAVGLVLSAVFVPCAFISGITGQFFRQFAVTIAVSTIISAFNSLTLSPALTALLLRPQRQGDGAPVAAGGVCRHRNGFGLGVPRCLGRSVARLWTLPAGRRFVRPLGSGGDCVPNAGRRAVDLKGDGGPGVRSGGLILAGRSIRCCGPFSVHLTVSSTA